MRVKRGMAKEAAYGKALKKAVKSACENPYWGEVYNKAPTEKLKRYYALSFLSAARTLGKVDDSLGDDCPKEIRKLYDEFTIDEWEYVSSTCGTGYMKSVCKERIKALEEKQRQESEQPTANGKQYLPQGFKLIKDDLGHEGVFDEKSYTALINGIFYRSGGDDGWIVGASDPTYGTKELVLKYLHKNEDMERIALIDWDAFKDNDEIESAWFGKWIEVIDNRAFECCSNLKKVILHKFTDIGENTFYGCDNLSDVYFYGTEEDKANLQIDPGNECLLNATWHYKEEDDDE